MPVMSPEKRTKRLARRHLERLAKAVNDILDEEYGGHDTRGAQTAFAKVIGVSQSHVSQITRGGNSDRGVGLPVVIAIRDYLREKGRPITIDELLGLDGEDTRPPPPATDPDEFRLLREAVEQIRLQLERAPPAQEQPQPQRPHVRRRPKET